ncbi:hypothetical protein QZH41_017839 [Actinostola sp. cb2023]|nr:hypothetical protein QZH41_017839 [Actinostola sp. cb2023]
MENLRKREKPSLYLNRPIYVGFCILDLSKTLMYDFHYNVIKQKYGNNATLLFTDTDSLCYNIKTEDIYEDMYEDLDLYDTSEYPRDHVLHSTANKKVLGKMKDETHGLPIEELVGLRPKMYSLLYHEEGREVEKKTAKSVAKHVTKHRIRHTHYRDCLFEKKKKKKKKKKNKFPTIRHPEYVNNYPRFAPLRIGIVFPNRWLTGKEAEYRKILEEKKRKRHVRAADRNFKASADWESLCHVGCGKEGYVNVVRGAGVVVATQTSERGPTFCRIGPS